MKPAALLAGVLWSIALSAALPVTERPDTIRVLWRDPGPIGAKDLYWGAGSADRAPKPPFTFVKEDTSGTKPKIEVTDAGGVEWTIKLAPASPADNEVHAEIAASRLIWAFGFFVDENYFVREGRIEKAQKLSRAADLVGPDGTFRTARFERKARGGEHFGNWAVENNAFNGTKELSALKILIVLVGNWDARPENAAIVRVARPDGDVEERYLLSDLGTAFGRWAGGFQKQHSQMESRRLSRKPLSERRRHEPAGIPVSADGDRESGRAGRITPDGLRRSPRNSRRCRFARRSRPRARRLPRSRVSPPKSRNASRRFAPRSRATDADF